MEIISDILFVISNGLLIPVLLLLIWFLIKGVVMVISLLPEYIRQQKERKAVSEILESSQGEDSDWIERILSVDDGIFKRTLSDIASHSSDAAYCERKIANCEIDIKNILGKSRSLIKFGPMLGLMGTLIPMGPALVGLASGDLATMAYNMEVAFATTVIGMVIAAIGVATLRINQRYYSYTLNDIEFIYNKLSEHNEKQQTAQQTDAR